MAYPHQVFCLVLILIISTVNCKVKYEESLNEKDDLEKYINEAKQHVNPRYRLTYHVAAPVGWVNDPNGFSYFKGEYHLFYQYYPYNSVWGPMHWGHMTSTNLVEWKYKPTALIPGEEQCFSGSAVVDNGRLVLMYTGHVITDKEPFFNQSQYLAESSDGVNFDKFHRNPVIPAAPNESPDFRDPKMWRHLNHWYVIIGSTTEDDRGRVLLYRSKDLINWEFLTVLAESKGNLGYMWECPDFFELDGKFILLISPQGIEPEDERYKNLHQTGYIVGNFNYDNFAFEVIKDFQELDYGHNFYATQTLKVRGRTLLVAWLGMWEDHQPEAEDGWAGAMTIVRELRLSPNNKIIQTPVRELALLHGEILHNGWFHINETIHLGKAVDIYISGDINEDINISFGGQIGGGNVLLTWDSDAQKVILNRDGHIRQVSWDPTIYLEWRILLDTSSFELFCGEGDAVFSSRVYPLGGWLVSNSINSQDVFLGVHDLKRGVPE